MQKLVRRQVMSRVTQPVSGGGDLNYSVCNDRSIWRQAWGCREGDPDTAMIVSQRLSKLAKVKEEINAEGLHHPPKRDLPPGP